MGPLYLHGNSLPLLRNQTSAPNPESAPVQPFTAAQTNRWDCSACHRTENSNHHMLMALHPPLGAQSTLAGQRSDCPASPFVLRFKVINHLLRFQWNGLKREEKIQSPELGHQRLEANHSSGTEQAVTAGTAEPLGSGPLSQELGGRSIIESQWESAALVSTKLQMQSLRAFSVRSCLWFPNFNFWSTGPSSWLQPAILQRLPTST